MGIHPALNLREFSMSQTPDMKVFTPAQIAEILGLKVSSVFALLSRGELKAYHVGRRRVITEQQLKTFQDSRKRNVEVDMTYACGPALKL
jgi:excisionase family DNA binding protein